MNIYLIFYDEPIMGLQFLNIEYTYQKACEYVRSRAEEYLPGCIARPVREHTVPLKDITLSGTLHQFDSGQTFADFFIMEV